MRLDPASGTSVFVCLPAPDPADLIPAPVNVFDASGAFIRTYSGPSFRERAAPVPRCPHGYERCYACRFNLASGPGRHPNQRIVQVAEPAPSQLTSPRTPVIARTRMSDLVRDPASAASDLVAQVALA